MAEEAADHEGADNPELLAILELLIKNGADVHLVNYDSKSPYQYEASRYLPAKKIMDRNLLPG